jgi:hypothetical protein
MTPRRTRSATLATARAATLTAALAGIFATPAAAQIDFEGLGAMTNSPGLAVPASAWLSDFYLASHGVRFSTRTLPFVAVVTLGAAHATSGTLGIGGVTAGGQLAYDAPFFVEFFNPANTSQMATTSSFSIRNDLHPIGGTMRLRAFDAMGALLGSADFDDTIGNVLSLAFPGMHVVEVTGTSTTAFDDVAIGELTPVVNSVPEPATLALAAAGLVPLALLARRRRG